MVQRHAIDGWFFGRSSVFDLERGLESRPVLQCLRFADTFNWFLQVLVIKCNYIHFLIPVAFRNLTPRWVPGTIATWIWLTVLQHDGLLMKTASMCRGYHPRQRRGWRIIQGKRVILTYSYQYGCSIWMGMSHNHDWKKLRLWMAQWISCLPEIKNSA